MEKIRFGIISCAGIARKRFIPAIAQAANAELVGVASRNQAKADQYAAENGIRQAFGSYEALLARSDVDAVYIPLPNGMHKEWSLKAIAAGKHVLCEKPLAPTPQDCLELAAAAKTAGVLLMEAFMYRFHPLTEFVIRQVQSQALGEIETIQASFSFVLDDPANVRFLPEQAGGALMDVGCYGINCVRTFFNEEPAAVSAIAHYRHPGIDDRMNLFLRFESGRQGLINCGFTAEAPQGYVISGSKGWIAARTGFQLGVEHGQVIQEINGVRSSFEDSTNEYTRMIEHFAGSIQHGTPLRYDAVEAAGNMAVICAAQESAAHDGAWVSIDQRPD